MPDGNDIGESGFYVIFHDVAVGGSFNLLLSFFSSSDFKYFSVYLKVWYRGTYDIVEDAGLVHEKGFSDFADFCIVRGKGIYQICVVKVYFLNLSESAYAAGFACTKREK